MLPGFYRQGKYEWIKHASSRSSAQALVGKLAEIRRVLAILRLFVRWGSFSPSGYFCHEIVELVVFNFGSIIATNRLSVITLASNRL